MKVTIIIPTSNRSLLLRRALELQAAQTYRGAREIVIVDGGARAFAKNPLNVRALELVSVAGCQVRSFRVPSTMSVGLMRNFAIEHSAHVKDGTPANQHIIIHQDDDDFYAPTYLETLLDFFEAHAVDLGGASQFWHYDFLLRRGWQTNLWTSNQPYGATFVYTRAVWSAAGRFEDLKRGEDDAFFRAVEAKGFRARALQRPDLFVYMRHTRNISWRVEPIIDVQQTEAARAVLGDAVDFYDDLAELVSPDGPAELGPQWHLPAPQRRITGKPPGVR